MSSEKVWKWKKKTDPEGKRWDDWFQRSLLERNNYTRWSDSRGDFFSCGKIYWCIWKLRQRAWRKAAIDFGRILREKGTWTHLGFRGNRIYKLSVVPWKWSLWALSLRAGGSRVSRRHRQKRKESKSETSVSSSNTLKWKTERNKCRNKRMCERSTGMMSGHCWQGLASKCTVAAAPLLCKYPPFFWRKLKNSFFFSFQLRASLFWSCALMATPHFKL